MRCVECGGEMKLVDTPLTELVRGEPYTVGGIRRYECQDCHEYEMGAEEAGRLMSALQEQYRQAHQLLSPEQIRSLRESLGLGQTEFGRLVEANAQTVCRWERGRALQDARANKLMILLRDAPEAKAILMGMSGITPGGTETLSLGWRSRSLPGQCGRERGSLRLVHGGRKVVLSGAGAERERM